jgi:putative serine protease PepD
VGAFVENRLDDNGPVVSSLASSPVSGGSSSKGAAGSVNQVASAILPSVVSITFSAGGQSGEGSGVIISSDGQILTNNHVVAAAANGGQLTVTFQDNKTASAKILGRDPSSDLAVIKVDGVDRLKPATLGKSSDLAVGDQVVAIGSPLGLSGTVTTGIVSALNRPVVASGESEGGLGAEAAQSSTEAIQTDAAINPGNSGGPLVNMRGQVIGINSSIASLGSSFGGQSGNIGLGFAIPIDQARRIADELIKTGHATHAFIGVSAADSTSSPGAVLQQVQAGSPAAAAGLQQGDVVTKVGDRVVDSANALVAAVRAEQPKAKVSITYTRNGQQHSAKVTLGSQASQTS